MPLADLLNSEPVSPPRSYERRFSTQSDAAGGGEGSHLQSPRPQDAALQSPKLGNGRLIPGEGGSWDVNSGPQALPDGPDSVMGTLDLPHPASLDPRSAPRYQQPLLMTSFSYGRGRELLLGDRQNEALKEMRPVQGLPRDLNDGLESATWRDEEIDEGLDALLDCILAAVSTSPPSERPGLEARISATKVITWRGMMTRLMAAGYETPNSGGWEMNAMFFDDTLYLEDAAAPVSSEERDPVRRRQTYYGYAFESICTSAPPEERAPYEPPFDDVNTNVQWCAVVKANLGGVRMILGGEVDCVNTGALRKTEVTPDDFLELKTQMELVNDRDRTKFERFKMLKFYIQSFLLGTPLIRVGFRTREGFLTSIHDFPTVGIPAFLAGQCQPSPAPWSSSACISTAAIIIRFLLDTLDPSAQEDVARFEGAFLDQAASGAPFDSNAWTTWPVFRVRFIPPSKGDRQRKTGTLQVLGYVDPTAGPLRRPQRSRVGFLPASWVESRWTSKHSR